MSGIETDAVVVSCKINKNLQSELDKVSNILKHENRSQTLRYAISELVNNFKVK